MAAADRAGEAAAPGGRSTLTITHLYWPQWLMQCCVAMQACGVAVTCRVHVNNVCALKIMAIMLTWDTGVRNHAHR